MDFGYDVQAFKTTERHHYDYSEITLPIWVSSRDEDSVYLTVLFVRFLGLSLSD